MYNYLMESDFEELHAHVLEAHSDCHLLCPCCKRRQEGSHKRARTLILGRGHDGTRLGPKYSSHSQMHPLQHAIHSQDHSSNMPATHLYHRKHSHLSSSLRTFSRNFLILAVFLSFFNHATSHQMTPKWNLKDIATVDKAIDTPIESSLRLKIPDMTAIAGRLFYYQIPHTSNGARYQATEAGRPRLPPWLHLNKTSGIFTGVPLPSDRGRVYISIEGHDDKGTTRVTGSIVFILEVKGQEMMEELLPPRKLQTATKDMNVNSDATSRKVPSQQNSQCNTLSQQQCTPPILANLLLLVNFSSLNSLQRTNLFMIASEYVDICPEQLFLRSLDWSDQSGALLWSQLADSDFMDYFGLATILSFQIACGDQFDSLDPSFQFLLTRLERFLEEAEDGLIVEDGSGNVRTVAYEQWFVSIDSSLKLQSKSKSKTKHRVRRQIDVTIEITETTVLQEFSSTPIPSPPSPTTSETRLTSFATPTPSSVLVPPTRVFPSSEISSTPVPSLPSPTTSETRLTSFTTPTPSSVRVPPTRVVPSSEISRLPPLTRSPTLPSTTSSIQPITSMTFDPVTSFPVISLSLERTSIIPPTVRSSIEVPTSSPFFSSSPVIVPSSTSEIFLFTETIVFSTPVIESSRSVSLLMPMSSSELTLSISFFSPSPITTPTPDLTTEIVFPSETFIPQSSFFVFETSTPIFQSTPTTQLESSSAIISTSVVLSSSVVITSSPSSSVVITSSPSSSVVITPSPSSSVVITPSPSSSVVITPSPSSSVVITPSPSSSVVITPSPSSSVVITPSPSFILNTSLISSSSPSPSILLPMETSELTLSISIFTPTPTPSSSTIPDMTTETFVFMSTPVFEPTTSIILMPLTTVIATTQVVSTSIVTSPPNITTTVLSSTPVASTPILSSSPIPVNITSTVLISTPVASTPILSSSPIPVNITSTVLISTPVASTPILSSSPIPVNTTTVLISTPVFITPSPSPISICEMINCNNGTCVDLMNDFECVCYLGWTGEFCDTDIDFCEPSPCPMLSSLACEDGNSTYTCICEVGFTGQNCSDDIDECETNPCFNGGTCMNQLFGNFQCLCPEGFTGLMCEMDTTPCDPNPCPNRTTCEEIGLANFTCVSIVTSPTVIATPFLTTSPLVSSTEVVPPNTTSPTATASTAVLSFTTSTSVVSSTPLPSSTIVSSSPFTSVLETTTSVVQSSATESSFVASSTPIGTTLIPTPSPSPSPIPNDAPVLLNAIGTILVNEGRLFQFPIPEETFFDKESGSTSNLTLTLIDSNGNSIPNTSWIQIRDNRIEGLPLKMQVEASSITDYVFILRAEDDFGSSTHDFVTVRIFPQAEIANFLTVFFEGEFELFNQNLSAKLDLVTHLAGFMDETGTDIIYVKEFRSGSIAVSYNNLTISDFLCSDFQEWVKSIYLNGQYTADFVQALMPFIPIAAPIIEGPCNVTSTDDIPTVGDVDNIDSGSKSDIDFILATVVPAAIIIFLLLVIGIIAFMAYRSRRSERRLLVTDSEERTFLHRRPVFLPGETELPVRSRRPIVLPNEVRATRPLRLDQPPIRLEEVSESEPSSDDEELVTLPFISARTRLLPQGNPPQYTLPPDYVYPS